MLKNNIDGTIRGILVYALAGKNIIYFPKGHTINFIYIKTYIFTIYIYLYNA